ncbi:hypothetical protein FRC00_001136 [Tulasnella sp. 408]|nr:hypothetical protein FRC00_001136 [Tulasnella sp. 408]
MAGETLSALVLRRLAEEVVARAMDSDINDLEVAMRDATQTHDTKAHIDALELVTSHVNQYRNRLVPIAWLPDEILLHIFHQAAKLEWIFTFGEDPEAAYSFPREPDVRSVYREVFKLQLVCRWWYNIIESDPRFWTVISPGMIGAPLEKTISNSARSKLVVLGQRGTDDPHQDLFLDQLTRFSDRFHSLVLTKRWNQGSPLQIWRKPLPGLVKLWLVNFEEDLPLDQADYFSGQPPSLRFLCSLSSPLPPHPPMYGSLEFLFVSGSISHGRDILIDVLPNARRLRTLQLRINSMGNTMQTEGCPAVIELPQLEFICLRLSAWSFIVALLERIKMPNYKTLQVLSNDIRPESLTAVLCPFFHEALHATKRPIALDVREETFEFRTEAKTIFLSRPWTPRTAWPDFFVGFEPSADAPIIRVALFLGTRDSQETPDPSVVFTFNSDRFIFI